MQDFLKRRSLSSFSNQEWKDLCSRCNTLTTRGRPDTLDICGSGNQLWYDSSESKRKGKLTHTQTSLSNSVDAGKELLSSGFQSRKSNPVYCDSILINLSSFPFFFVSFSGQNVWQLTPVSQGDISLYCSCYQNLKFVTVVNQPVCDSSTRGSLKQQQKKCTSSSCRCR